MAFQFIGGFITISGNETWESLAAWLALSPAYKVSVTASDIETSYPITINDSGSLAISGKSITLAMALVADNHSPIRAATFNSNRGKLILRNGARVVIYGNATVYSERWPSPDFEDSTVVIQRLAGYQTNYSCAWFSGQSKMRLIRSRMISLSDANVDQHFTTNDIATEVDGLTISAPGGSILMRQAHSNGLRLEAGVALGGDFDNPNTTLTSRYHRNMVLAGATKIQFNLRRGYRGYVFYNATNGVSRLWDLNYRDAVASHAAQASLSAVCWKFKPKAIGPSGAPLAGVRWYVASHTSSPFSELRSGLTGAAGFVQPTDGGQIFWGENTFVGAGRYFSEPDSALIIKSRTPENIGTANLSNLVCPSFGIKLRKYGYVAYSTVGTTGDVDIDGPTMLSIDQGVALSEAQAQAISTVSINWILHTISVSGLVTVDDIYSRMSFEYCQLANMQYEVPFTSSGDMADLSEWSIDATNGSVEEGAILKRVSALSTVGEVNVSVTTASGTSIKLTLRNVQDSSVAIVDNAGVVFASALVQTSDYNVMIPAGSTGNWIWVVKRAGYEHARGSFDPSSGSNLDVRPSTPQKLTPEGQPMFAGAPSALVTLNIGNEAEILIGDGMATLQGTFDAIENALTTTNGLRWIAGGGDDCSIFNSAGGDYLFLTAGWRLKRDAIMSANSGVNAFVISTDGVAVDESNGPVRFLTSDASTSIATAVRQALLSDLAAIPAQVWEVSLAGNKTPGTTGSALQDTSARVASSL